MRPSSSLMPGGAWPVMLTPFTASGAIDWPALDALVEWYLAAGVSGLFAVCLSSEMFALTGDERLALAAHVVRRVHGRVPVVATGVFAPAPAAAQAQAIRAMAATGVDAVVLAPSLLVAEDDDDTALQRRLEAVLADTGEIPLGLYECPRPYHRLLSPRLFGWAASTGRFGFHKDTSCSVAPLAEKARLAQETPLTVLNANCPTLLDSLRAGVRGYCGTAANFCPELFTWLCARHADAGVNADACQHLLSVIDFLVRSQYPLSAKVFLAQQGLPVAPVCREMAHAFNEEERVALRHLGALLREARDHFLPSEMNN